MRLTIELTTTEGARLSAAARMKGIELATLTHSIVTGCLPEIETETRSSPLPGIEDASSPAAVGDADRDNTIALLKSWLLEDATDDPEELCQAQRELDEFKLGMDAPRKEAGARLLFPEVE